MPIYSLREFLEELESKTPEELKKKKSYRAFIDFITQFGGKEEYYREDFLGAINMINRIEISSYQEFGDKQFSIKLTSQDILTSEFLLEKISPWVEETRKKIFSSTKPPFDWEDAVKWIENEAKKYGKVKSEEEAKELMNRMKELTKEFGEDYFYLDFSKRTLPYAKRGDEWIYRVVVNNPKFEFLEFETRNMAKKTGFPQTALVIHVLSGLKIVVSRLQISTSISSHALSKQETLFGKEINLKIRARDFTYRELWDVYKEIKKEINLEKDRPLKDKHLLIHTFVKKLGKPPDRGKQGHYKFWSRAEKKWNDIESNNKYKGWQGLRGAYERIVTLLERAYIRKIS